LRVVPASSAARLAGNEAQPVILTSEARKNLGSRSFVAASVIGVAPQDDGAIREAQQVGARIAAANRHLISSRTKKAMIPIFIASFLAAVFIQQAQAGEISYTVQRVDSVAQLNGGEILASGSQNRTQQTQAKQQTISGNKSQAQEFQKDLANSIQADTRAAFAVPLSLLKNKNGEINFKDIQQTVTILNKVLNKAQFQLVITDSEGISDSDKNSLMKLSKGNVTIRFTDNSQDKMLPAVWAVAKENKPGHLILTAEKENVMTHPETLGYDNKPAEVVDHTYLFAVEKDAGFGFSLISVIVAWAKANGFVTVSQYGYFEETLNVKGIGLIPLIRTLWTQTLRDLFLSTQESAVSA
jgi:hypothetical protein